MGITYAEGLVGLVGMAALLVLLLLGWLLVEAFIKLVRKDRRSR